MSLLNIRDLSLSIAGVEILQNVSVDMQPGEIVAITGESGSGKSLTALATMALLPRGSVVKGQIFLDENDILTTSESELCAIRGRKIGMVFQEPMTALNPVKTIGSQVAETILIHERISKMEANKRATDMLRRVGLEVSPLRYPHELSGGQRQRVVIAMAIVLRPKLLIADEPTTALDVTTQARILELLKDLVVSFDMGLLIITHDLAVVAEIADKIVVMQNGQIVETAKTEVLLYNMKHPYTRALFNASTHRVVMPEFITSGTLLSVDSVVRTYSLPRNGIFGSRPNFNALENVSFNISHGERVGLVLSLIHI